MIYDILGMPLVKSQLSETVLPLCKIRKGVTNIEIGGFELQTGDFENKSQNTYKMIF